MDKVSKDRRVEPVTSAARIEFVVTALGVICGAIGYPLRVGGLEYVGVLLAVAGLSLGLARVLGSS
jgi:hypothetical protein